MTDIRLVRTEDGISAADMGMAKQVFDVLHRHYPEHPWGVNANVAGGIVSINLMYPDHLANRRSWGYALRIAEFSTDPMLRAVVTAGGEMLERWDLARARRKDDSFQRAKAHGLYKGAS